MTECDDCGATLTDRDKDEAGHYRDRCMACITASVQLPDECTVCSHPRIDACDRHD